MKNKNKILPKKKIKKRDIVKTLSNLNNVEDLFVLSSHLKEEDERKLFLKLKESVSKRKFDKDLAKTVRNSKDLFQIKEGLALILIDRLNNEYEKFYDLARDKRKKGSDTLIAELKLMSTKYKINLFRATKDKKDYLKIKKFIHEIEKLLS